MDFVFQRTYRGTLKAVLLDWAGTTMDYGCFAPAVVFMEVYKRKGVEISIEEARAPMGAHKKVHIRQISKDENVARAVEVRAWARTRRVRRGGDVPRLHSLAARVPGGLLPA